MEFATTPTTWQERLWGNEKLIESESETYEEIEKLSTLELKEFSMKASRTFSLCWREKKTNNSLMWGGKRDLRFLGMLAGSVKFYQIFVTSATWAVLLNVARSTISHESSRRINMKRHKRHEKCSDQKSGFSLDTFFARDNFHDFGCYVNYIRSCLISAPCVLLTIRHT